MAAALEEARRAASAGEVPVGAAVFRDGVGVARTHNESVSRRDPTAHAELLAIQQALRALATDRLTDCILYVTLEPCAQCAGAVVLAKVGRVVFGAYDPKAGMAGSGRGPRRPAPLNPPVGEGGGGDAHARGRVVGGVFPDKRQVARGFPITPCKAS